MRLPVHRLRPLAAPLAAVLCLGCAGLSVGAASNEERAAYERAAAMVDRDPAKGRVALEQFTLDWPNGFLEPEARLRLGELSAADDPAAALRHWDRVIRITRDTPADVARVRIASLEAGRGREEPARTALARVRFDRLESSDRREAYRLLSELAEDPVVRAHSLALYQGELEAPAEVEAVDVKIDAALLGLDRQELARLTRQLGDRPPIARVWLSRAERALDVGDLDEAQEALEHAGARPLAARYAPRLSAAIERLQIQTEGPLDVAEMPTFAEIAARVPPSTSGARGTLGAVLPLTGPFARFGEESLHGILLAAGIFGPPDVGAGDVNAASLRVLVRDSAGDPARAAAAVRELAADPSVSAIVGPLLSAESEAAAAAAQELGVPLVTLTARDEIAHLRSFVFRLRTRPAEETQVLVDHARRNGAERFAILYRNDPYGRGLRGLFWDAVEARGGRIVGVASYEPDATDFADPIRQLVGYTLLDDERRQLLRKREKMLARARRLPDDEARALRRAARSLTTASGAPLPPIVDFDALFIAESHENVVLIAPQLAFHEVFGARLLGPDGWYHEDLVRVGRENVEGAVFVAHYFPESQTSYVRDFAERYAQTFRHGSNVFAAQAYDAANLVLVQLARGRSSRQAVRDGVLATSAYPGVSGVLSMGPDGNAHKRPFLLGVERGNIVQLDE